MCEVVCQSAGGAFISKGRAGSESASTASEGQRSTQGCRWLSVMWHRDWTVRRSGGAVRLFSYQMFIESNNRGAQTESLF